MVNNMDCGNNIDLITIDLCKALDSIPHDKLSHKLSKYGMIGKTLNWISSFLNNRVFNVFLNSEYPSSRPVLSSVPQGSCSGPYLYAELGTRLKWARPRPRPRHMLQDQDETETFVLKARRDETKTQNYQDKTQDILLLYYSLHHVIAQNNVIYCFLLQAIWL